MSTIEPEPLQPNKNHRMRSRAPALTRMFLYFNLMAYSQLIIEDQDVSTFELEGKWQSLNNRETVIEFLSEGVYITYSHGEVFFKFTYKVEELEDGLFTLEINTPDLDARDETFKGATTEPQRATIQIVNQDRIRIYYWKHKEILDIADEYSRTDDLNSFKKLIKRAIEETK